MESPKAASLDQADDAPRRRWLSHFHITETDDALAERLHRLIDPHTARIVDELHAVILANPDFTDHLGGEERLHHLRRLQEDYVKSLGLGVHTRDYFVQRLHIGMAHVRIGLPIDLYIAGQSSLMGSILAVLGAARLKKAERAALIDFANRACHFDMALVTETYHERRVRGMETSIQHLRDEGERLRQEAHVDVLTQAFNRRYLLELLDRTMSAAARDKHDLCVLMLDIDHFKRVNDTYGHAAGDEVLRHVVQRAAKGTRGPDTVGRFGGEEFVVVLPETDIADAKRVADRICAHVAATPIQVDAVPIQVTVSLGVAKWDGKENRTDLLTRVDAALYAAKRAGRNRVFIAEPALDNPQS